MSQSSLADQTADLPAPPLTLVPVIPALGGASSSTEFRWCLSPELQEEIAAAGPKPWFIYLLVVVTNGGDEMSRQLFPIHHGQRYVRFFRPGTNVVHATVVYSDNKDPKTVLTKRNDEGEYSAQVLADSETPQLKELGTLYDTKSAQLRDNPPSDDVERGRLEAEVALIQAEYADLKNRTNEKVLVDYFSSIYRVSAKVELEIIVSEHAFGKPNWWITRQIAKISAGKAKGVDPCHVRRQALAALPTLLMIAVIGVFVFGILWPIDLLAIAVLLLAGKRGINFDALRKPWDSMPNTIWEGLSPSIWTHRKIENRGYRPRAAFYRLLNPGVFVVLAAGAIALGKFVGAYAVVALLGCFLLALAGIILFPLLSRRIAKRAENRQGAVVSEYDLQRAELLKLLAPIACSAEGGSKQRPGRPSFALRYERVKKALGCLPFAK